MHRFFLAVSRRAFVTSVALAAIMLGPIAVADDGKLSLTLRSREALGDGGAAFASKWEEAAWQPSQTAIIICDMWDSHHSVTAVRRVNEFAPRLNEVLKTLRARGATIIHSPSDCMNAYAEHPARANALAAPKSANLPDDVAAWCHMIPAEEKGAYPIDQSDGGEDEDAFENAQWAAQLEAQGRNPGTPWLKQTPLLEISTSDYVAAEGDLVWNVLQSRGIKNVILAGVHTNMCVLGRPFGLRQMVRLGMNTVLMRDCTDVMYNPKRWPYVSHFTGIDLIVNHIEQFVCPTITSNQIVGGEVFRFAHDKRPHLVMIIGEQEYETLRSLHGFEKRGGLGKHFRVNYVIANEHKGAERNEFRGGGHLDDADVVLVSVRRRAMASPLMQKLRRHVSLGKSVLGIRTSSHAFAPREAIPDGYDVWPTFDADVFGGNYTGHHGNKEDSDPESWTRRADSAGAHPILSGIDTGEWKTESWLYKTSPLKSGAHVLLTGRVTGRTPHEPVAWTFVRKDGGRSVYTSLGHVDDFSGKDSQFRNFLKNAIYWSAGMNIPEESGSERLASDWTTTPWTDIAKLSADSSAPSVQCGRTLLRVPHLLEKRVRLIRWIRSETAEVFLNGTALKKNGPGEWAISENGLTPGDLNLIALKANRKDWTGEDLAAPKVVDGKREISLRGESQEWQFRVEAKDDPSDVTFPIPPQFGASTDQIQNWAE